MFEVISQYGAVALDYSVISEFAGTPVFDEFTEWIMTSSIDVYVSKTFKTLHYCSVYQTDVKNSDVNIAMKNICSFLLPDHRLHLVQEIETCAFIDKVNAVPDCVILTTRKGIFTKRLYEKQPELKCVLAILCSDGIRTFGSVRDLADQLPLPALSRLAGNNTHIDSSAIASVMDVVKTADGSMSFELVKRLSGGAEGMVFLTDQRNIVAKIYHKGVITPLRWAKLKKLSELGINGEGFCLPRQLLYFQNVPVGYTMTLGRGVTLGNVFDGPDALLEQFPKWTRLDVVDTLLSLIENYLYLHMHDVIAGDIQLKNALIYSSSSVYLIDMDSVQISNLPCPVGTEEFTDPRLWGRNFSGFVRTLGDEDYSIAMLVFSVLFCGLHPYATRRGAETLREEIINRNFPYTLDNSEEEHIPLGGYNQIWRFLPESIRVMLYETFRNGKVYEAIEWLDAVLSYKEQLMGQKIDSPEAYKVFPLSDYDQASVVLTAAQTAGSGSYEPLKPRYVKKTFTNAPSGKYVPKDFRPQDNEEQKNAVTDVENTSKKGKFLGLF